MGVWPLILKGPWHHAKPLISDNISCVKFVHSAILDYVNDAAR